MIRSPLFCILLLLVCLTSRGQSTRSQDLLPNVDTTLRTDADLRILRSDFPVTVSAGRRWQGSFTLQYAGPDSLVRPLRAAILYENRGSYRSLMQPIGTFDNALLRSKKPVVFPFEVLLPDELPDGSTRIKLVLTTATDTLPLRLPLKYDQPPGYYYVGKINVLARSRSKKKRTVFFGDSITQEGTMPDGYISQLDALAPAGYELIGAGVGGDRVTNLYDRLAADVLTYRPDVVVVWVGVNDCGWFRWVPAIGGTTLARYEAVLGQLVQKIQRQGARVVLCTPAVIGEKHRGENDLDTELDKYAAVVRRVAGRSRAKLVDMRTVFTRYLQTHNPDNRAKGILTSDGVHPTPAGNKLVAKALFPALF